MTYLGNAYLSLAITVVITGSHISVCICLDVSRSPYLNSAYLGRKHSQDYS